MSKLVLFLAAFLAAIAAHAAPACSPDKFEIVSKKAHSERGILWIIGKVKNNNAIACGVQLKVDVYDKQKNLVDTVEKWPARLSNIKPGATYSFKLMAGQHASGGYSIEPIRTEIYPDGR